MPPIAQTSTGMLEATKTEEIETAPAANRQVMNRADSARFLARER